MHAREECTSLELSALSAASKVRLASQNFRPDVRERRGRSGLDNVLFRSQVPVMKLTDLLSVVEGLETAPRRLSAEDTMSRCGGFLR